MYRLRSRAPAALRPLVMLVLLSLTAAACAGEAEPNAEAATTIESPLAQHSIPAATPELVATPAPTATAAPPTQPAMSSQPDALTSSPIGDPQPAPVLADLIQPDGTAFDLTSLRGSNVLVFFGYTHCPDVCPATIGELFGVFQDAPETQAVFVSVDPERDTPEFLTEWTTYLPENLHAVTGSPGAIRRAADNYGVKYARVETTSTAGYTMSHSADLYLIDENGQLLLAYPFGTPAAEIVKDLETLNAG